MAFDLDIRQFLRKAPRDWLRRYFDHHGVLAGFNWESVGKRKIDPLHEAFQLIEEPLQNRMAEDFRNIAMLGTANGKLAIIDEAVFHKEVDGFAEKLSELEDFYACAFWTYLNRPKYYDGAVFFAAADGKPGRYWRTRINMPRLGRDPTSADAEALGKAIGRLFKEREGRGGHCTVHPYRRRELEYFFAYPKDHPQTAYEYEAGGKMTKRPFNPAFEMILILDDRNGTLDIWHQGKGERVKDLQVVFARSVLGTEIPPDSNRDTRIYDLAKFLQRDVDLKPAAFLGIRSVSVRKLRLHVLGDQKHTVRIDLSAETADHVLYDRLEAAMAGLDPLLARVSMVGFKAEFELRPGEKDCRTRRFEITWPNSCSLESTGDDALLRRFLQEHRVVPLPPPTDGDDDGIIA